jgi:hypothetical protein
LYFKSLLDHSLFTIYNSLYINHPIIRRCIISGTNSVVKWTIIK